MLSHFVHDNEKAMTQWLLSLRKNNASFVKVKTFEKLQTKEFDEEEFVFV
tara:strand:+ start:1113 stop:1262 length:150 start_codon:yes stop_codon:yes gene_type:complete